MITNERCLRSQRHVKANQDIIGEHCIRNEEEMCRVSEEYKKLAWKSYHRELQKTACMGKEYFVSGRFCKRVTSVNRQGQS